jgi:riboflavin kinase/FMN adenylyltransferase
MIVEQGLNSLASIPPGSTMSIGNFDGVHLGHQAIIRTLQAQAGDGERALVTFEPHPLTVLKPHLAPPRLSTTAQKHAQLNALGIDRLIELPPSQDVLNVTAEAFFSILRDQAKVKRLVEGSTFNFGKGRGGNIDRLKEWTARGGIGLTIVDDVKVTLSDLSIVSVNSSLIRWLLAYGRAADAAICLGRPYAIEGKVVHGEKRGRTIGFPTANLACEDQLLPAPGVYSAQTVIDGNPYKVALSIGTNPHFDGKAITVEAYLLDFTGDLYDKTLSIEITSWIREQWKFPSLETLIAQLHRDVKHVREST